MTYYVADENGFLGDFASGGGLQHLRDAIHPHKELYSVNRFLRKGFSVDTTQLAEQAAKTKTGDSEIDGMLASLAEYAAKAQGVLILSDGTTDQEGD